ncbi:hypothetical protein CAPTEDRAFT_225834 [Capitella teleta]|uniref:F-box domain-containing protein n=1 Tax=Capitella teleta TaxID=283909 RepID=R7UF48_CAPTE|nr:hypothetical protein CAPTEDRAFT_225834 [Capitella teleta]|eukprot:ELU04599.1 hypothetical protein CAPTEDRAFT_225834 [Capitella teleta]
MQELGDWAHWRASGLVWEKTEEGWRRVQGPMDTQPEGLVVVIESTSITQVLDKLDFMGAVKDIRRFRYVCNFLEMLIREKFPQLSGMAQKKVMLLLEAILDQAIESEIDLHLVCSMVRVTQQSLMDGIYRHMGGKRLWSQHFERVHRMQQYLQNFELTERQDDGLTLTDLPDDVLREILLRLPDHTDLLSMSEVDKRLQEVSNDEEIWKELTLFHFGECMNASHILKANKDGWKSSYKILSSQFTPRVEYPEQLCICSHCNAMFWELHGHPCLESKAQSEEAPQEFTLSPKDMVLRFS